MFFSQGIKDAAAKFGWGPAMANGVFLFYDGAVPVDANAAISGTLINKYTLGGNAYTPETQAVGSIIVTGGAIITDTFQPKVAGITLCAAVPWATSNAATALALVAAINASLFNLDFTAAIDGSNSAKVDLTAPYGTGANFTGAVVTTTLGGAATTTLANFAGGVTAINGLVFYDSGAGLLLPNPAQVWQGTTIADGSPKYFRYVLDSGDTGAASTVFRRIQGTIATANADLNIPITTQQSVGGIQSLATSGPNACSFQV